MKSRALKYGGPTSEPNYGDKLAHAATQRRNAKQEFRIAELEMEVEQLKATIARVRAVLRHVMDEDIPSLHDPTGTEALSIVWRIDAALEGD